MTRGCGDQVCGAPGRCAPPCLCLWPQTFAVPGLLRAVGPRRSCQQACPCLSGHPHPSHVRGKNVRGKNVGQRMCWKVRGCQGCQVPEAGFFPPRLWPLRAAGRSPGVGGVEGGTPALSHPQHLGVARLDFWGAVCFLTTGPEL